MADYIVGIDFGHGETAAWVVPMFENDKKKADGIALKLRLSNDKESQKIPSVVYYDSNGKHSLVPFGKCGIVTGMKDLISELSDELKLHYAEYIRLIVERILLLNNDILEIKNNIPNFKLCIASPTKWNEEQKSDYLNFFNEAIADLNLRFDWIINESDAAYFTHCNNDTIDDKCCLIIDYGSSTVDYTVMKNGRKISDDSWSNKQIGARCIEHDMYRTMLLPKGYSKREELLKATETMLSEKGLAYIDPYQYLIFELRKEKEGDYTNQTYDFELLYKFSKITSDHDFDSPVYDFYGNINDVTKEYCDLVAEDLNVLKEKIQQINEGKDPDKIILSGGASIMQWFNQKVHKIFECDDINDDRNTSYVVAHGIALYARAQERALNNLIEKIENINFYSLYIQASNEAFGKSTNKLMPAFIAKLDICSIKTSKQLSEAFFNFFRSLNENNIVFSKEIEVSFNNLISTKIWEEVKNTIRYIFNLKIQDSKPEFSVPITVPCLTEDNYLCKGSIYCNVKRGMANTRKLPFAFDIDDVQREKDDIVKLSNGVVKFFSSYSWNVICPDGLDDTIPIIKENSIEIAKDLFYKHQLFKTTFKK
jgi:hypothetical protein